MNNENSLKKNTIILTIGTVLNKGLQFLVIPFFSRWLSTAEYGEFDLLYTYVSLMIPIISLASQEAMFRFSVDEKDEKEKRANITNTFIINICNFFVAGIIIFLMRESIGENVYIILTCYVFVELMSVYLRGLLRAIKRLEIYSLSMIISTIFMAVFVTVFVLFMDMGLEGILLGYTIGTLSGDIVICILVKVHNILELRSMSFKKMKKLVTYSAPLIPNDVAWWVMNASDRQIINIFFGSEANGIYAIAHKIPALCSVVFNMFSISWQQDVVTRINDENRNKYFNDVLNRLLELVLTVCACLLAGSFILYYFIFDLKYFEAIKYSPILIVAAILVSISQFFGGIQIALKQPKQNGVTTVIGAISNIVLHIALWKVIGLYAAAISTLIANSVIVILRIGLLRTNFKIYISKKTRLIGLGFIYFFIMAYVNRLMVLNIVNLFLGIVFFGVCNKEVIKKLYEKIL